MIRAPAGLSRRAEVEPADVEPADEAVDRALADQCRALPSTDRPRHDAPAMPLASTLALTAIGKGFSLRVPGDQAGSPGTLAG